LYITIQKKSTLIHKKSKKLNSKAMIFAKIMQNTQKHHEIFVYNNNDKMVRESAKKLDLFKKK
jgi:hypothetical protein